MKSGNKLKVKEFEVFETHITIFENGDVYLSTKGDVHIIEAKRIIDISNDRVKNIIEDEDTPYDVEKYFKDVIYKRNKNYKCYYSKEEMELIKKKK